MEGIGKRLKKLIENKGVTAYEVSQETKIAESTLSRIINSDSKPIKKNRETLAKYFGISESYLLTGKEHASNVGVEIAVNEPFEHEYSENRNDNQFLKLSNGQYLMTMPLAEVPTQGSVLDNYQDTEYLSELPQHSIIVDSKVFGRYMAFRVEGHSMDNGKVGSIPAGYIVSARELQPHLWSTPLKIKKFPEWVIYTTENSHPIIKRIIKHDVATATITCQSYNEDKNRYPDFELSLNNVRKLFNVIDVSRGDKNREY